MLSYIVKLLKSLNANADPGDIAHAVSLGMLLGFMPKNNILWYILFIFFLFVRINKGAYFLMMLAAACIAPLLDPLFDTIGYTVLTVQPLKGLYSRLLDIPFVGFTKFNNTIVAGSLVFGLILYIPCYAAARIFIRQWRTVIAPVWMKYRFIKFLYTLPLISKIVRLMEEE